MLFQVIKRLLLLRHQFDLFTSIIDEALLPVPHISPWERLKEYGYPVLSTLHDLLVLRVVDHINSFDLDIQRVSFSHLVQVFLRIELAVLLIEVKSEALHLEVVGVWTWD